MEDSYNMDCYKAADKSEKKFKLEVGLYIFSFLIYIGCICRLLGNNLDGVVYTQPGCTDTPNLLTKINTCQDYTYNDISYTKQNFNLSHIYYKIEDNNYNYDNVGFVYGTTYQIKHTNDISKVRECIDEKYFVDETTLILPTIQKVRINDESSSWWSANNTVYEAYMIGIRNWGVYTGECTDEVCRLWEKMNDWEWCKTRPSVDKDNIVHWSLNEVLNYQNSPYIEYYDDDYLPQYNKGRINEDWEEFEIDQDWTTDPFNYFALILIGPLILYIRFILKIYYSNKINGLEYEGGGTDEDEDDTIKKPYYLTAAEWDTSPEKFRRVQARLKREAIKEEKRNKRQNSPIWYNVQKFLVKLLIRFIGYIMVYYLEFSWLYHCSVHDGMISCFLNQDIVLSQVGMQEYSVFSYWLHIYIPILLVIVAPPAFRYLNENNTDPNCLNRNTFMCSYSVYFAIFTIVFIVNSIQLIWRGFVGDMFINLFSFPSMDDIFLYSWGIGSPNIYLCINKFILSVFTLVDTVSYCIEAYYNDSCSNMESIKETNESEGEDQNPTYEMV